MTKNVSGLKTILLLTILSVVTLGFISTAANRSFGEVPSHDMKQAAPIDLSQAAASSGVERAMFAGGCFWGTQYSFQNLAGVTKTVVGYSGGHTKNPTYQDVCNHGTGQAESVYIEFDPKKLTYKQLVDFFWTIHDPTTMDRQGPDFGDQYRSVIFYTSKEQKEIAEACKKQAQTSGKFGGPIVTQIVPAAIFYPAEEYHQNYDVKHGSLSCPSPVHK